MSFWAPAARVDLPYIPSVTEPNEENSGGVAFVRAVSRLSGRVAGSVGERQAQELMAGRLHRLGFEAVVEGAVCPPPPPGVLALHAAFGLLGLLLTYFSPPSAALVGAIVAFSFWGELRGAPLILQRLLLRRVSGNMVARLDRPGPRPERSDTDRRSIPKILLIAHADVARASTLFQPWFRRLWDEPEGAAPSRPGSRPSRRQRLRLHPGSIVLLAASAQAVTAVGVSLGLRGALVATVLGAAGIVHLGLGLLALDWWRSPPVEGAIDNGSGMAVLVGVAEEVAQEPLTHAELWVVATGDREPDAGGMEAFLFQFGTLLDPAKTALVNVDDVGLGALHIGISEGRWDRLPYKPFVTGLAERLARTGRYGEVKTTELVGRTDAGPATEAGFSAVTLTCLVDGSSPQQMHTARDRFEALDPATLAHAQAFAVELVRTLDRELAPGGPDLALDGSAEKSQDPSSVSPREAL